MAPSYRSFLKKVVQLIWRQVVHFCWRNLIPSGSFIMAVDMFCEPLQDTQSLLKVALKLCRSIFKDGCVYHKAGVMAYPLTTRSATQQQTLFESPSLDSAHGKKLSSILDKLNHKHGAGTIRYAICGLKPGWAMKADYKTPAYTTQWKELMQING